MKNCTSLESGDSRRLLGRDGWPQLSHYFPSLMRRTAGASHPYLLGRFRAIHLLGAVFTLLATSVVARGDATQDGAGAFAKGDFPAAVRAFETAIASAVPNAGLYYNLGMAQLKAGQRPQAALSFRRAILLDPRMIDARMALSDIERSQGVARPKSDWRGVVAEKAPLQVLVVAGCALAWLGAFLLLFVIFKSGRKILPFLASAFLLAVGAALFLAGTLSDPRIAERHAAVVLADEGVTLLAAPADQSATVTKLPAGAALRILQRSGDWAYCQTPLGEKGWGPSKALATVVPSA